ECRDAHAQQRRDQRALAADAVAVVAEDGGADRAPDEPDEVGAERRQRRGHRVLVGEVQLAEHEAGGGAVEEEVVPLDGGADGRSDDGLAQLVAVIGGRQRPVGGCCSHGGSSVSSSPPGGFATCPLCYVQEVTATGVPSGGRFSRFALQRNGCPNEKAPAFTGASTRCPWGRGEWGARQQVTLATRSASGRFLPG